MTPIKCSTCGKDISLEAKICPNCATIRYIGVKIDHIIILIVVVILSITIFNTYTTEQGQQNSISDPKHQHAARITPVESQ